MPPLAEPSSLESTTPVMPIASANTLAWAMPFCPVVASSTSSTSSTGRFFSVTRRILPSSSIRFALFCKRPAVSMMSTSACSSFARAAASNATDAGSAPSLSERTTGTPTLAPHVSNWSAAAARNVSAAPIITRLPSATNSRASLPAVVVLPVPFTPTMMMTDGVFAPSLLALSRRSISGPTRSSSLERNASRTCAGSAVPVMRESVRSSSTSCAEASAPTSASSNVSSTSSQSASERLSLARMLNSALPKGFDDLASLARSRSMRERAPSGLSNAGWTGVGVATADAAAGSVTALDSGALPAEADVADCPGASGSADSGRPGSRSEARWSPTAAVGDCSCCALRSAERRECRYQTIAMTAITTMAATMPMITFGSMTPSLKTATDRG